MKKGYKMTTKIKNKSNNMYKDMWRYNKDNRSFSYKKITKMKKFKCNINSKTKNKHKIMNKAMNKKFIIKMRNMSMKARKKEADISLCN
jgi:prephenate dehydrogenase